MNDTKTVFKFFTIPQYKQEEAYLSAMHEKGWMLTHITFPGFYHFEKCEPQKVTYCLDYNQEGMANKKEYVQLFADCGWDYMFDFVGYSYFRKETETGQEKEEIFCDDSSRLDMMKRVFRGRIIPLIIIFTLIIIPQIYLNVRGYGSSNPVHAVLSIVFLVMAILYLIIFAVTSIQFYQYERKVLGDRVGIRLKYIGIITVLVALALASTLFVLQPRNVYTVEDRKNGFAVEAERMSKPVIREYELKRGDIIDFHLEYEDGSPYLSIAELGEEPVFFCDYYITDILSYEIQKDGYYQIEVSGRNVKGRVEVEIR